MNFRSFFIFKLAFLGSILWVGVGCTIDASIFNSQSAQWQLQLMNAPTSAFTLTPFGGGFQLALKDSKNQPVVTSEMARVEIFSDPTGNAKLLGATALPVVNGIVDLSQIGIDLVGTEYQLQITIGGQSITTEPFNVALAEVQVQPFFPINGARFMDYVPQVKGLRLHEQLDQVATTSTVFFHGGEIRKVVLPDIIECHGLSIIDSLDLFHWECNDEGSETFFYSRRFQEGKGLRDALLPNAFKPNQVVITKGSEVVATSQLEVWWQNPVQQLTLNSVAADPQLVLADDGTIYTVSTGGASRGISITGNRIALVTLGEGTTISNIASLATTGCSNTDGVSCLISGRGNQGWIEIDASLSLNAKTVDLGNFAPPYASGWRVHNSVIEATSSNFDADALYINSSYTTVTDSSLKAIGGAGLHHRFKWHQYYDNLRITGGLAGGLRTHSWYVVLNRIQIFNSLASGFYSSGFYKSILNSQVVNNAAEGVDFVTHEQVNIRNSLFSANGGNGVNLHAGGLDSTSIIGNTFAKNNQSGLTVSDRSSPYEGMIVQNFFEENDNQLVLDSASNLSLKNNILARGSGASVVIIGNSSDLVWSEKFILDSNEGDCSVATTGTNPGLVDVTCENQGSSSATKLTSIDTSSYFEGSVTDPENAHGNSLPMLASSIIDWSLFSNRLRSWITEIFKGPCHGSLGSCLIFDFSLKNTATEAQNINGVPLQNEPCPSAYSGQTEVLFGSEYMLPLAIEKIGDLIGDEDGSCESHEDCIIQNQIGANLDFERTDLQICQFEEGVHLTGIRLFFAPQ